MMPAVSEIIFPDDRSNQLKNCYINLATIMDTMNIDFSWNYSASYYKRRIVDEIRRTLKRLMRLEIQLENNVHLPNILLKFVMRK